jgi:hypothetical protein
LDAEGSSIVVFSKVKDGDSELEGGGVDGRPRVAEFEGLEGVDQDAGDDDVAVPLLVRGNDKPGGVLATGGGEDVLISGSILWPELALAEVGGIEFPVLVGVVETGLEAASLLVAGDVEEELEDDDVVIDEEVLELVDVVEALADDFGGNQLMDAGDEHILVVGAVEDADHSTGGNRGVTAPEEVVTGFERSGNFEGCNVATLRIDAGEDVADGPVLAGGVQALKDDEDGLLLTGVKDFLVLVEGGTMLGQDSCGGLFGLISAGLRGGELR